MTKEEIQADFDKRELTKADYAKLMGVDVRTVYRWLSGDFLPTAPQRVLFKLSSDKLEELQNIGVK